MTFHEKSQLHVHNFKLLSLVKDLIKIRTCVGQVQSIRLMDLATNHFDPATHDSEVLMKIISVLMCLFILALSLLLIKLFLRKHRIKKAKETKRANSEVMDDIGDLDYRSMYHETDML